MCVLLSGCRSMEELVVMIMGRWSEGSSLTVLHVADVAREGEQKVMSGEEFEYPA